MSCAPFPQPVRWAATTAGSAAIRYAWENIRRPAVGSVIVHQLHHAAIDSRIRLHERGKQRAMPCRCALAEAVSVYIDAAGSVGNEEGVCSAQCGNATAVGGLTNASLMRGG
jgi:hypothetical protein